MRGMLMMKQHGGISLNHRLQTLSVKYVSPVKIYLPFIKTDVYTAPMTRLLNMRAQHKLDTLEIVHPPMSGLEHLPNWITIINCRCEQSGGFEEIDSWSPFVAVKGKLWARAISQKKKGADDTAARTAIKKLSKNKR